MFFFVWFHFEKHIQHPTKEDVPHWKNWEIYLFSLKCTVMHQVISFLKYLNWVGHKVSSIKCLLWANIYIFRGIVGPPVCYLVFRSENTAVLWEASCFPDLQGHMDCSVSSEKRGIVAPVEPPKYRSQSLADGEWPASDSSQSGPDIILPAGWIVFINPLQPKISTSPVSPSSFQRSLRTCRADWKMGRWHASQIAMFQKQLDWVLTYFYKGLQALCIINQNGAVWGTFAALWSF